MTLKNRRLLAEWAAGSLVDEMQPVDLGELISAERQRR
jgi:hypothetical protein